MSYQGKKITTYKELSRGNPGDSSAGKWGRAEKRSLSKRKDSLAQKEEGLPRPDFEKVQRIQSPPEKIYLFSQKEV